MASNNYAEVITDAGDAKKVLDDFERWATLGKKFQVLEFNPDTDRIAISLGREQNWPPLPEVEGGGTILDGQAAKALWRDRDSVKAVSFGNGHVDVFSSSNGLGCMIVPAATVDFGDLPDELQESITSDLNTILSDFEMEMLDAMWSAQDRAYYKVRALIEKHGLDHVQVRSPTLPSGPMPK